MTKSIFDGYALKLANWPTPDQQAWHIAEAVGDIDLMSEHRPASLWRKNTKELHMRCYGIWLAWLQSEGLLDEAQMSWVRATPQMLTRYVKAQRALGKGSRTLVNHIVGIRHMLEALAPDIDWKWMLPTVEALKATFENTKNHADLPSIKELFELGLLLMQKAEYDYNMHFTQRALMFRNGLAISLLAARPYMRRENLAKIQIDKNLIFEGDRFYLKFGTKHMKGGKAIGSPVPAVLTEPLRRYLSKHRKILLKGNVDESETLFISWLSHPVDPHNLSNKIGEMTDLAFGRRVCCHEFRHAAGSSIAKQDPDNVGIVPGILGHSDYRTSEQYYIHAEENEAFQRLNNALNHMSVCDPERVEMAENLHAPITKIKIGPRSYGKGKYA